MKSTNFTFCWLNQLQLRIGFLSLNDYFLSFSSITSSSVFFVETFTIHFFVLSFLPPVVNIFIVLNIFFSYFFIPQFPTHTTLTTIKFSKQKKKKEICSFQNCKKHTVVPKRLIVKPKENKKR